MKLRVEKTMTQYYCVTLDEEESNKVVAYAKENDMTLEEAVGRMTQEGDLYIPEWDWDYMDSFSEFNFVGETYES